MVRDAESFAAKDKERKALIDAKNDADSLLYTSDKSLLVNIALHHLYLLLPCLRGLWVWV
jgi:molecular chaperone DnaK (HSP70)